MIPDHRLTAFVIESNMIEGIHRVAHDAEIRETCNFLNLPALSVPAVVTLVQVYEPAAILRNREGLDVQVGNFFPPDGGPHMRQMLNVLLGHIVADIVGPYQAHREYENLHPFTDGNGRSGRAIWAWQMSKAGYQLERGFLHEWYYQSLRASR